MLPPIPRRSVWCTCCRQYPGAASGRSFAHSPSRISLPRNGSRVGLRVVLFEACSAFTRVSACTLALSPIRDTLIEGFSHFVTSVTAPIASGWSGCRVGLAPTGKRRLFTAHAKSRHDRPHSSTLAPKQEKRIRLRPPIVIDPPIVAAPRRIASLDVPIAPGKKEAGVAPEVVARKVAIGGRLARYKPALRLVAQHRDKFGAIVGLATQRLVRNDDRGARQGDLRDSIEHVLRDGDAVERVLGFIPVVDRDCGPAQARVVADLIFTRRPKPYVTPGPWLQTGNSSWQHLRNVFRALSQQLPIKLRRRRD